MQRLPAVAGGIQPSITTSRNRPPFQTEALS
jgi:hypothetical protein